MAVTTQQQITPSPRLILYMMSLFVHDINKKCRDGVIFLVLCMPCLSYIDIPPPIVSVVCTAIPTSLHPLKKKLFILAYALLCCTRAYNK